MKKYKIILQGDSHYGYNGSTLGYGSGVREITIEADNLEVSDRILYVLRDDEVVAGYAPGRWIEFEEIIDESKS